MQVQVEDQSGRVSMPLDDRFQEGVDAISMFDGSGSTDDYLTSWEWGQYIESEGSGADVAGQVAARFNQGFPSDFVARVRELHRTGRSDPRAGAADHWCTP